MGYYIRTDYFLITPNKSHTQPVSKGTQTFSMLFQYRTQNTDKSHCTIYTASHANTAHTPTQIFFSTYKPIAGQPA